jgi:hypothetical protein
VKLVPLLDELGVNGRAEILPAYRRVTPAVCAMSESGACRDRTGDLRLAKLKRALSAVSAWYQLLRAILVFVRV